MCFCYSPPVTMCQQKPFKIGSLQSYLLCVDTTLVYPLSLCLYNSYICVKGLSKQINISLKWSGAKTGLNIREKAANVQRKPFKKAFFTKQYILQTMFNALYKYYTKY